jgi:putative NADH-flavin reductase
MQTILGSGGAIGIELAKALKEYSRDIRLVSRNPQKVNATDVLFPADLQNEKEVNEAIEGSSIVYVTVGFPYAFRTWKEYWPPFLTSSIT